MRDELSLNYFFLNDDCILIKGALNGAIYDLKSGHVYSLTPIEKSILNYCEESKCLKTIAKLLNVPKGDILKILQEIKRNGLGHFYKNSVFIDKNTDYNLKSLSHKPVKLDTLVIELHRRCDLNCLFCDNEEANSPRYAYCGCRKERNPRCLTIEKIKSVIREGREFNLNSIYFIGGDPFLFKEKFFKLLEYCRKRVNGIWVHTHAGNLNDEGINLLNQLEINLDIPVYSHDEKLHDNITGTPYHYKKLISVIETLVGKGINFNVIHYIGDFNSTHLYKTQEFFKNLGCCSVTQKFIYPKNKMAADNPFLHIYNNSKKNFPRINKDIFFRNKTGNMCLSRKLAISRTGEIAPCHIIADRSLGNVKEVSINEVLRMKEIDSYWELSKDKLEVCNECEYRYLCIDCPILEHRADGKFYQNFYCRYNPQRAMFEE